MPPAEALACGAGAGAGVLGVAGTAQTQPTLFAMITTELSSSPIDVQ